MGYYLVQGVEKIKKIFNCHTYHIEMVFVAIVLTITALLTNKGIIERIGVLAVLLTFGHMSVAQRLEESERDRYNKKEIDNHHARCFYKLQRYYYAKEICWFIYFVFLGARSALVGVVLFLCYGPWRKLRRSYHPL